MQRHSYIIFVFNLPFNSYLFFGHHAFNLPCILIYRILLIAKCENHNTINNNHDYDKQLTTFMFSHIGDYLSIIACVFSIHFFSLMKVSICEVMALFST